MVGEQVIDRHPILGAVTLHLIGSQHDCFVEFGVGVGQPEFFLQEIIAYARNLVLVGERDRGKARLALEAKHGENDGRCRRHSAGSPGVRYGMR